MANGGGVGINHDNGGNVQAGNGAAGDDTDHDEQREAPPGPPADNNALVEDNHNEQGNAPPDHVAEKTRQAFLLGIFLVCGSFAYRVKQITEKGRAKSGDIMILIIKSFLYGVSSVYILSYAIYYSISKNLKRHLTLLSFSLRSICFWISSFLTLAYNLAYLIPCFPKLHIFGSGLRDEQEEECFLGTVVERFEEVVWFFSLGIFICFNGIYPRETRMDVLAMTVVSSSAIYGYFITAVFEMRLIYYEVRLRVNATDWLPIENALETHEGCFNMWDCTVYHYLEFFYVMISEFEVVASALSVSIILEAAKRTPTVREFQCKGIKWLVTSVIVLLIIGFCVFILIKFDFHKSDPEDWETKLIFMIINLLFTIGGLIISGIMYYTKQINDNTEGHQPEAEHNTASHKIEMRLLYFGGFFAVLYIFFGIVHSIYLLLDPEYADEAAIGSLIVDVLSLIQIWIQTELIARQKIENNSCCCVFGTLLVFCNVGLFVVNIFDASTLGIVANTIPVGTNLFWAMWVRGLSPFDVFYRFHSMAMLSEMVEEHFDKYGWKQHWEHFSTAMKCCCGCCVQRPEQSEDQQVLIL